jgi:DNA-directed RNA polymerase specialized sigma24 family protein
LRIMVECESPKYAKGKYEFEKLEEVFKFLVKIKGFAKSTVGSWLLTIAKDGCINGTRTARSSLKIKSDFHDYELAQKVAEETGLIRGFGRVSPKLDIALAFAKAFDKEANKH